MNIGPKQAEYQEAVRAAKMHRARVFCEIRGHGYATASRSSGCVNVEFDNGMIVAPCFVRTLKDA